MTAVVARDRVVRVLDRPRSPRELVERTGLKKKTVEGALRRLVKSRMAECANPDQRQPRFYRLTWLGELFRQELCGGESQRVSPPQLAADEMRCYAFVQSGIYRRVALRHLAEPMTGKQLRRSMVLEHDQVGDNHVHEVLRGFAARGIAIKTDGRWSLTPLGERLRATDLHGLPERPRIRASVWWNV